MCLVSLRTSRAHPERGVRMRVVSVDGTTQTVRIADD
jgi:hypothetical protein